MFLALDGKDNAQVITETKHIVNDEGEQIVSITTGRECGPIVQS